MRKLTVSFLLALLTFAFLTAAVADKVTTDPNAPGAKAVQEAGEESQDRDSALDKKITYDGPDLDLTKMLSEISLASGVKMQPSAKAESWQVRQRTAIVFLNNARVSEFKNGLAKLFGYRWTRVTADTGKRSYTLREIDIQKATRQGKIDAAKQAQIDANRANVKAAIDTAEKATNLSPEELKNARENDPWLYYLATNPSGKKWGEVIRTIPSEWWEKAALGKGRTIYATTADPAEQKITALVDQILKMPPSGTSSAGSHGVGEPIPDYFTYRSAPLYEIRVSAGMLVTFVMHTTTNERGGASMMEKQIENCPIEPSKSFGCMVAGNVSVLMEDGKSLEKARQPALDKTCDYVRAKDKDPEPDSKTDPALLKEIEHKPIPDPKRKDEPSIIAHLRGLAKETGFTIMLETFDDDRDISPKGVWAPDKGTIFDILSGITTNGRMAWEKSGNVILLRYKEWPKLRTLEVSKDLVKRWEDAAKAHDYLTLDDLYDIVSNTTDDQATKTLTKNKLLSLAGLGSLIHGPYYAPLKVATMLPDDESRHF